MWAREAREAGAWGGQVVDPAPVTRKRGPPGAHEVTVAKSVAVSACGNFGVVGYACGRIDRYNMQSGAHRGTYWAPAPAGHASAVLGVAVDGLGETLVSGGFDGAVKVPPVKRYGHEKQLRCPVLSERRLRRRRQGAARPPRRIARRLGRERRPVACPASGPCSAGRLRRGWGVCVCVGRCGRWRRGGWRGRWASARP